MGRSCGNDWDPEELKKLWEGAGECAKDLLSGFIEDRESPEELEARKEAFGREYSIDYKPGAYGGPIQIHKKLMSRAPQFIATGFSKLELIKHIEDLKIWAKQKEGLQVQVFLDADVFELEKGKFASNGKGPSYWDTLEEVEAAVKGEFVAYLQEKFVPFPKNKILRWDVNGRLYLLDESRRAEADKVAGIRRVPGSNVTPPKRKRIKRKKQKRK